MTGHGVLAGWRDRSDRVTWVLLALVAAHVLVKVWAYSLVGTAPLTGDERAYADGARALSNLVRDLGGLRAPDTAELSRNVVGSGWFMPGMSLLAAPFFLLVPDGDAAMLRLYLAVVTSVLLVLVAWRVRCVLGARYAAALLVMPGLVPMWAAFSMALWGDLVAGLVVVLLLCELVPVVRLLRAGRAPDVRCGVRLGLLAIAAVYFRSSTALLVVGLGLVAAVLALTLLRGRVRGRAALAGLAGAGVFLLCLAPWSVAASTALDGRVLATTSVPTVLANTFGDRDRVCFGPCDPGSTLWFSPLRYARETGAVTDEPEMVVLDRMSTYARADVTPRSYSRDVLGNLHDYVKDPDRFFRWLDAPAGASRATAGAATTAMVWAAFAVGVATLLLVVRRRPDLQVLSLFLTLGLGALLTQPFVHIAGPRYWTTAAPLLGLAAALLVTVVTVGRGQAGPAGPGGSDDGGADDGGSDGGEDEETLRRWLTRAQVALATSTVVIAAAVVGLATLG